MSADCVGPCADGCHDTMLPGEETWIPLDLLLNPDLELMVGLCVAEVIIAQRDNRVMEVGWEQTMATWPQDAAAEHADQ